MAENAGVLPDRPALLRAPMRTLLLGNLLAALLVALLAYFVLGVSRDAYTQRAQDAAAALARALQQAIAADLDRVDLALRSALLDPQRGPVLPGVPLQRVDAATAAPADAEWLARVRSAPGLVVSEPQRLDDGRWVLRLARRLPAPDGRFDGALVADVPVERLHERLSSVDLGPSGAATVRSATLRLVARRAAGASDPQADVGTANVSAQLREALASAPASGRYVAPTALDRVERANAYERVGDLPLVVLVGLSTEDFLAPWRREVAVVVLLAALAVAVLALSSVLLHRAWRRERLAHAALEGEAQLQQALMETASDGIHVLGRDGRVLRASDSFATMLGYAPQEVIGLHHADWDPRYLEPERAARFRAFQVGGRYRFTTRHRRKDGQWIDVEVVSVGLHAGGRDLLYCVSRDISARERATRALRASESLLDRIGRVARVGGWEFDLATRQFSWSAQMRRLLETGEAYEPTADELSRFYPAEAWDAISAAGRAAAEDGTPWDIELPMVTARGRPIWVRTVGEREDGADGRPARLVGTLQDITERRQRVAELARERAMREQTEAHAAELDALLRERSEMLDILAHEVRQPLNNASAALQSLAKARHEPGDEAAATRLARAQTVMSQVLANIDNTLATAALLARTGPLAREDEDIDTLVAVAIADMPAAERPRVIVQRFTRTRTASMDMSLMRLALRNVLANALKFSPAEEPVQIAIADSDDPLALILDVSDRGSGVDDGLLPRLFERGARTQDPGAPPGHGLGMYIAHRVMELHGGRIELVRNGPWGATFRLLVVQEQDAG